MNNSIADVVARIKNGYMAQKQQVEIKYSKMNLKVAEILKKEKYLKEVKLEDAGVKKTIHLTLLYNGLEPAVSGAQVVSRSGRRIYGRAKYLKPIIGGYGTAILTTPKGILTDREAKKMKLGGEILFTIW